MNQIITQVLLHQKFLKLFFSLLLFLGLTGCSGDDDKKPTPTTTTRPSSTTTTVTSTTSTTTTTISPLQVIDIANDTASKPSKTWTWSCEHESGSSADENCEFRFAINQLNNYKFSSSDNYKNVKTATKSRGEDGTYYLHVQTKNSKNVESDVKTVSFMLKGATTKALRVTGIDDDAKPRRSKTWTWSCNNTPCEFRFDINQNPNFDLTTGRYGPSTSATKGSTTGQGTFYLHVQARNTNDNEESAIKTVSFILEEIRVTGLTDDSRERSSKRWTWNCNTPPCTFRHAINQEQPPYTFPSSSSNSYSTTRTVTETIDDVSNGEGKYYLHVQAKDADDNASSVKSVFFMLKDLEVMGLENDTIPRSSKTWTWGCNSEPCTFRYEVTRLATYTFPSTRNYISTISITRNVGTSSSGVSLRAGTYYIHVQAKDKYGVESEVKAARFTLQATSRNTLEVVGLVSDTTPTNSKIWNWNCDNPTCEFRSIINQSPTQSLSGEAYNSAKSVTRGLESGDEEGIYYLHVQARDSSNTESDVKTVSFILQRGRDFVSTLELELQTPDPAIRHASSVTPLLPLYPEKDPRIKVMLDGSDLAANTKIQFYSSLTCNSSRTLSDSITLVADDTTTTGVDENAVNINLYPGVHNIYAGVINGNNLQCSTQNLPYIVYNPVVAGHEFTCYLTSTGGNAGDVQCWGSGDDGRLGSGGITESSNPARVDLGQNADSSNIRAKFITTGSSHACAILEDNNVKCWGEGSYGRLGTGNDNDIGDSASEIANTEAVDLGTGRVAKVISAGGRHTCAILDNDDLKCWGRNNEGQLGLSHSNDIGGNVNEMGDALLTVNLGTGRIARAIATGDNHTCAILDNGDVKCWGRNNEGQLGQGHTNDYGDSSSETVSALSAINLGTNLIAKAIATGNNHTCVLLDDTTTDNFEGSLKCWGENDEGQLGQGNTNNYGGADISGTPAVDESNISALNAISFGTWNHDGDDGTTPEVAFTAAKAIAAGEDHTCAILSSAGTDQVKCWGLNDQGQLGQDNAISNYGGDDDPTTTPDDESDIAAMDIVDLGTTAPAPFAISITAGDKHTCAFLDTNNDRNDGILVKCWGHNNKGQLAITVSATNVAIGDGDDGAGTAVVEMGDNLGSILSVL